jgi:hypothetical protein
MRMVKVAIIVVACFAWLSSAVHAGQQRGHSAGGGGRSGGSGPSRGQSGAPPAQGRSGAETGGSAGEMPNGPFISRLGMVPRGWSPSSKPFFGRGRGVGVGLPWFDPLWWSDVPPGYEIPQDPDELSGARGAAPSAPIPPAGPSFIQPLDATRPPALAVFSTSGTLRLNVEPTTAQVYVDGFYVGSVADFSDPRPALSLPTGWHRLEFRAPGFVTPAVNVTIGPDRTTTYEGKLQPIEP